MTDLDEMLREYLLREKADPLRERFDRMTERQEHQAEWAQEHERKDDARHHEVMRAIDGHHYRIGTLESKAGKLEKDVEDTGRHEVEDMRAKLRSYESVPLARPSKRPSFPPKWARAALSSGIAKGVYLALVAALAASGWVAHLLGK